MRIWRILAVSSACVGMIFVGSGVAAAKASSGAPARLTAPRTAAHSAAHTTVTDSDGGTIVDGDMRYAPKAPLFGGFAAANNSNPPVSLGSPTVLVAIINVGATTQKWPTLGIKATFAAAAGFYATSSDGQFTPNFAFTDPITVASCNISAFSASAALLYTAIRSAGYEPNNYDNVVFYTSGCASSAGVLGIGTLGGRDNFIISDASNFTAVDQTERSIVHEYGHNLGLVHASALYCRDSSLNYVPLSADCSSDSTGDEFSPMGYSNALGDFSAFDQWTLGWGYGGRFQQGKTGTYVVNSIGAPAGLQFLAIPRADGSTFFVEYRSITGLDAGYSTVTPGALVRWARFADNGTAYRFNAESAALILTRPATPLVHTLPPHDDATIRTGDTWTTPEGDVSIQVVSRTPAAMTVNVTSNGAGVISVNPDRVLDTRTGNGAPKAKVAAGGVVQVDVTGRGTSLVPDNAKAVVLNVTASNTSGTSYVTVWPCGEAQPDASNINTYANSDTPNAVVAKIGAGGLVCLFSEQSTDLIADINGYYPINSSYHPINPTRILDTRLTSSIQSYWFEMPSLTFTNGRPDAGKVMAIPMRNLETTLDRYASVAVFNVTAVNAQANGYATVWPCFTPQPPTSSMNATVGRTRANLVVSGIGGFSYLCVYVEQSMDLIIDVAGWMPLADPYVPITPGRLFDNRDPIYGPVGRILPDGVVAVNVFGQSPSNIPNTATSVMLNVTSTGAIGNGYLTVWPCSQPRPDSSNLNMVVGSNIPNAVLAKVDPSGLVCIYSSAATFLIVDAVGYQPG